MSEKSQTMYAHTKHNRQKHAQLRQNLALVRQRVQEKPDDPEWRSILEQYEQYMGQAEHNAAKVAALQNLLRHFESISCATPALGEELAAKIAQTERAIAALH